MARVRLRAFCKIAARQSLLPSQEREGDALGLGEPGPTSGIQLQKAIEEFFRNGLAGLGLIGQPKADLGSINFPMSDKLSISAAQSRAARALIDWTRAQLAEASGVSAATLADFEAGKRTPYDRTLADVRSALRRRVSSSFPRTAAGRA
jgi:DNA-binding XRE family transcriptional regulator